MIPWNEQLHEITNDENISEFFSNKSLKDFIYTYMRLDVHINCKDTDKLRPEILYEGLKNIQDSLNPNKLKTIVEDSLKNNFNNEIKNLINNNENHNFKESLANFKDHLVNVNLQNLNEFDRKSLNMISNIQKEISTSLDTHVITHKINSIDTLLTSLNNNFTNNSSKKGQMTENMLFFNLVKAFGDSDVINTSNIKDACDIQIKKESKPDILIDSKHFQSTNVPKCDLVKFHENCKLNNSSGILCNAFGGIANKNNFEIDIHDESRILVYIWNHEFDSSLFKLAVRIIYNIHEIIKEQKTDNIKIDQQLFQRLKIEYTFFIQSFNKHLVIIKSNINSLEQLTLTQLDQFFKRTSMSSHLKPFSCPLCATGCSTDKALKRHLRDKHDVKTIRKKEITEQTEIIEETNYDETETGITIHKPEIDNETESN